LNDINAGLHVQLANNETTKVTRQSKVEAQDTTRVQR